MKKITLILVTLLLSACMRNNIQEFNEVDLADRTINYLNMILDNNISKIYDDCDDNIKTQLSKEDLNMAITNVLNDAGEYLDNNQIIKSEVVDDNYLISLNLDYTIKDILFTISYNMQNEISGIWLKYTSNNEKYFLDDNEELMTVDRLKDYPLDAIYTKSKKENAPIVIMIQGSGQSDMDETIGMTKAFKDIAKGLSDHDISSIRYNKRYYTYPELADNNVTVEDEIIDDILYIIDMVKEMDNTGDIYLLGHSLGAMLIPSILNERDDIKGAVLMAGSPRNLVEIIKDQNNNLYHELIKTADDETIKMMYEQLQILDDDINSILNLNEDSDMNEIMLGASARYWYSLNQKTDQRFLNNLNEDLFIIQGGADFQVFKDIDYQMYYELLSNRDNVYFKLYEGLNHLMMPSNGKLDNSEYNTINHVDDAVIGDIAAFINKR